MIPRGRAERSAARRQGRPARLSAAGYAAPASGKLPQPGHEQLRASELSETETIASSCSGARSARPVVSITRVERVVTLHAIVRLYGLDRPTRVQQMHPLLVAAHRADIDPAITYDFVTANDAIGGNIHSSDGNYRYRAKTPPRRFGVPPTAAPASFCRPQACYPARRGPRRLLCRHPMRK